MAKRFLLIVLFSLSSCNVHGHLGKLSGLLLGGAQEIHNKVHDVAGSILGGLNFDVHGHVGHHRHPAQQPNRGGETIVIVVEENNNNQQPQPPYNPNQGYTPNNGYNNGRPDYGQGFHQNAQNNGNYGQNHQRPAYPTQPEQHHNQNPGYNQNNPDNNQNGQGNNHGNVNPNENGHGNPNNNVIHNTPNPNSNDANNPEHNKPNLNDNYKPTEVYNGHHTDNPHKYTNDKTTKKPLDDGPLFVPLNDYTYGGDKTNNNSPKRDTDKASTEKAEEDFPIDIRFKDE